MQGLVPDARDGEANETGHLLSLAKQQHPVSVLAFPNLVHVGDLQPAGSDLLSPEPKGMNQTCPFPAASFVWMWSCQRLRASIQPLSWRKGPQAKEYMGPLEAGKGRKQILP